MSLSNDFSVDESPVTKKNGMQKVIIKMNGTEPSDVSIIQNLNNTINDVDMRYRKAMAIADVHLIEVTASSSEDVDSALTAINNSQYVEWAELDRMMLSTLRPNDEFFQFMWHLQGPDSEIVSSDFQIEQAGINVEPAWDITTGEGAVIAVIDIGYTNHIDLIDNLLIDQGFDFITDADAARDGDGRDADAFDEGDGTDEALDPSVWHGTHVSGIIAAVANNSIGISGVAFNSKILPVRALGVGGGLSSDIAEAIVWASGGSVEGVPDNQSPADVINLSLGVPARSFCSNISQAAVNIAIENGSTVVVAAGNDALEFPGELEIPTDPATCEGVIAVAATDRIGNRAFYSNFGDFVSLAAPGGDVTTSPARLDAILSIFNGGRLDPIEGDDIFVFLNGTSMAAPHVSGVAALLYSLKPSITPGEVFSILTQSVIDFPGNCSGCGAGLLSAKNAVEALNNTSPAPTLSPTPIETPNSQDGGSDVSPANNSSGGGALCLIFILSLLIIALVQSLNLKLVAD